MYKHQSNQLPPFFQRILQDILKHNYPKRSAQDYSTNKTKKMFSDCAIRNCGPTFWNSMDKIMVKHYKTTEHFRNQLKSVLLSDYT